ncbi:MAG: STAS domain-containing protein [Pirellulaceae bacterium]
MRYEYFTINRQSGVLILELKDPRQFNRLLGVEFARELSELAHNEQPDRLVVDLAEVGFCTSELVEGLLRVQRTLGAHGGRVRLCHVRGRTAEVFRVLRLDRGPLAVDATRSESLRALETPLTLGI